MGRCLTEYFIAFNAKTPLAGFFIFFIFLIFFFVVTTTSPSVVLVVRAGLEAEDHPILLVLHIIFVYSFSPTSVISCLPLLLRSLNRLPYRVLFFYTIVA